jgi:hypothetical protein
VGNGECQSRLCTEGQKCQEKSFLWGENPAIKKRRAKVNRFFPIESIHRAALPALWNAPARCRNQRQDASL